MLEIARSQAAAAPQPRNVGLETSSLAPLRAPGAHRVRVGHQDARDPLAQLPQLQAARRLLCRSASPGRRGSHRPRLEPGDSGVPAGSRGPWSPGQAAPILLTASPTHRTTAARADHSPTPGVPGGGAAPAPPRSAPPTPAQPNRRLAPLHVTRVDQWQHEAVRVATRHSGRFQSPPQARSEGSGSVRCRQAAGGAQRSGADTVGLVGRAQVEMRARGNGGRSRARFCLATESSIPSLTLLAFGETSPCVQSWCHS